VTALLSAGLIKNNVFDLDDSIRITNDETGVVKIESNKNRAPATDGFYVD
jgi:hypothetical protein